MVIITLLIQVIKDPFEGYEFFGNESRYLDGNLSTTLYGGLWSAYIRSDDHVSATDRKNVYD